MYGESSAGLSVLENVTYVFDNIILILSFVWFFVLLTFIVASIGKWLTFKKMNRNGYEALIPYHNTYEIIKVANMPGWHIFLLIIPIWGIIENIKIHMKFAEAIGKSKGFGIGLALVPFVFFLILGFDKRQSFFANPNDKFIGTANAQDGINNTYLVDSFSNVETFNAPQGQVPLQNMQQPVQQTQQVQFVQPTYAQPNNNMMMNNQMPNQMMNTGSQNQPQNNYPQNNIQQNATNNNFNTPNNQP